MHQRALSVLVVGSDICQCVHQTKSSKTDDQAADILSRKHNKEPFSTQSSLCRYATTPIVALFVFAAGFLSTPSFRQSIPSPRVNWSTTFHKCWPDRDHLRHFRICHDVPHVPFLWRGIVTAIIHGCRRFGPAAQTGKGILRTKDMWCIEYNSGLPVIVSKTAVCYSTGTSVVRVEYGDDGRVRSLVQEVPCCRRQPR